MLVEVDSYICLTCPFGGLLGYTKTIGFGPDHDINIGGFLIFSHAAVCGITWANRRYRDRDASCGSARLLTLSKVTLPTAELINSNMNLTQLEIENDHHNLNNYVCSRTPNTVANAETTRPVTRSLTRLTAPRQSRNPVARSQAASSSSTSKIPETVWVEVSPRTEQNSNQKLLQSGTSGAYNAASGSSVVASVRQSNIQGADNSSNSLNAASSTSTRISTRSSTRGHSLLANSSTTATKPDTFTSNAVRSYPKSEKSSTKSTTVFRSIVSYKSSTLK